MATSKNKVKVHVLASQQELSLIDEVIPKRKRSRFLMEAGLEKAKEIKKQMLAKEIKEAFDIDADFFNNESEKWEHLELEGWPKP